MNRLSRWVLERIREQPVSIVHDGRRLTSRWLRHDERLDAEAADEALPAFPLVIGLDVTLIPSQPERRIGELDYKKIKLRIWR